MIKKFISTVGGYLRENAKKNKAVETEVKKRYPQGLSGSAGNMEVRRQIKKKLMKTSDGYMYKDK